MQLWGAADRPAAAQASGSAEAGKDYCQHAHVAAAAKGPDERRGDAWPAAFADQQPAAAESRAAARLRRHSLGIFQPEPEEDMG